MAMVEVRIFDALVYLVPGIILMCSIFICLDRNQIEKYALQSDTFLGIVFFAVAAFSAGFVIHLISGPIFVIINKVLFGFSPLHHATDVFAERHDLAKLKIKLENKLGIQADDFTDLYRYATYAVISSENPLANRVDRLQSLALMSRNLTVTVPLAAGTVFLIKQLWRRGTWRTWIALGFIPVLAGGLHMGAWQFSIATVLATYRSVLLLY